MTASALPQLLAHMEWADMRTLESLRAMREPPPQAIDLFAHGLAATHVWIRRVEQASAAYEVWPKLSLDECERLARANHIALRALATSDADRLARLVHYTNLSGRTYDTSLEDILLHLTHHAMYHRGQVALLMRAAGGNPVGADYITFVRP